MFSAGQEEPIRYALRKQQAVRALRRSITVGDIAPAAADRQLAAADCDREQADAIYRLTSLCRAADRFVLPPGQRESAAEEPAAQKQTAGFGFMPPLRGQP
jgi:nitrate reductase beta subunit